MRDPCPGFGATGTLPPPHIGPTVTKREPGGPPPLSPRQQKEILGGQGRANRLVGLGSLQQEPLDKNARVTGGEGYRYPTSREKEDPRARKRRLSALYDEIVARIEPTKVEPVENCVGERLSQSRHGGVVKERAVERKETFLSVPSSSNLVESLERARRIARDQKHHTTLAGHLLQALVEDPDAAAVLQAGKVDLPRLSTDVSNYLSGLSVYPPAGSGFEPCADAELLRVLQSAKQAAQESRPKRGIP